MSELGGSTVTVCDTCRRGGWEAASGAPDGALLAEMVERAAEGTGVLVRRHPCLMGCSNACNVAIQAPGKMGYSLGGFDPEAGAASAIVAYAALHAASAGGIVAFRDWPAPIRERFIARHPPLPAS